ncbi:MAG TPA: hypothetical protein VKF38_01695 [Anaerolineaceae bacterium]|nr:hypothetical protein [Anaerolineaceae bacterium]
MVHSLHKLQKISSLRYARTNWKLHRCESVPVRQRSRRKCPDRSDQDACWARKSGLPGLHLSSLPGFCHKNNLPDPIIIQQFGKIELTHRRTIERVAYI